mmetsp:Transcript_43672/g.137070  ORF Transcript_43672/g.137070 Transcript_43672/m.137070 type:complete len:272 (+) Transcript_43672:548-1363(+)
MDLVAPGNVELTPDHQVRPVARHAHGAIVLYFVIVVNYATDFAMAARNGLRVALLLLVTRLCIGGTRLHIGGVLRHLRIRRGRAFGVLRGRAFGVCDALRIVIAVKAPDGLVACDLLLERFLGTFGLLRLVMKRLLAISARRGEERRRCQDGAVLLQLLRARGVTALRPRFRLIELGINEGVGCEHVEAIVAIVRKTRALPMRNAPRALPLDCLHGAVPQCGSLLPSYSSLGRWHMYVAWRPFGFRTVGVLANPGRSGYEFGVLANPGRSG